MTEDDFVRALTTHELLAELRELKEKLARLESLLERIAVGLGVEPK